MNRLVPPRFLFRWSFAAMHISDLPNRSGRLLNLPDGCRLRSLSELDSLRDFADIRVAWNENGLAVNVEVKGRSRKLVCDPDSWRDSDGIQLLIDTRNTQNVHRATRFCHQFCLLPTGGGAKDSDPVAIQVPLARAREESILTNTSLIKLESDITKDGYWLDAWLPAEVFVGFDPATSSKLGFHYRVHDRDLGDQSLAIGSEFPVEVDPSLWQTLELV